MSSRTFVARAAAAGALLTLTASAADAQCPVGALCFFGTDVNGSSTVRATNVNSANARTNFFANLTGVGTEDFEGQAGQTPPIALLFPGAGTATLNGPVGTTSVVTQGPGTNGVGRYPTSGTAYLETVSAAGGGTTFSVAFSQVGGVAAFGFYGIDVGEFGSQLSLRFSLVGGGFSTWALPYVATNGTDTLRDGSILYAGIILPTNFTSVEFLGTSADDFFGFDDLSVGSRTQVTPVVPEPSTYALMGVGLATLGLGALRRRRARG